MSFTVLILDGEMVVHDWKEYISLQENPQNYHYRETGVIVSFCSQPQDHYVPPHCEVLAAQKCYYL